MDKDTLKMVQKMARAEVILEKLKRGHKINCIVDMDPDSMKPCDCDASEINALVEKALQELKIDN